MAHAIKANTSGATPGVSIPRLFDDRTAELSAPVQCHHCEDAPCGNICQMSAISRVNGRTVVDTSRCIGCKLCLMACPFGAIEFVPLPSGTRPIYIGETKTGGMDWPAKFLPGEQLRSMCASPQGPACVETCPQKALELVNPATEKSKRNTEAALDLLLQVGRRRQLL